jgi:hypothetical protein
MKNAGGITIKLFTVLFMSVFILICFGCSGGGSGNTDGGSSGSDGNAAAEICNPMDGQTIELTTGWSEPVPTTLDTTGYCLTDLQQPGSRIYYISISGDNSTAEIYFWDGTQIVDYTGSSIGIGGVAYGTDPMNPTGPIRPFARWSYVVPRRPGWGSIEIGEPWDGTSYKAPGADRCATRYEYPDWWLFKRGDTFDLFDDYLSFARETNPDYHDVSWLNNPDDTAIGTTNDTSLSNNTLYARRAAAAADLGRIDPDRTLKSYFISLGYAVNSDDGYMELFNAAMDQRKGYWNNDLTSRAIVNYFRAGFNMAPLPYLKSCYRHGGRLRFNCPL